MLDNVAIDVGPSRFARALGVLVAGALAIAPALTPARSPLQLAERGVCAAVTTGGVRPRASLRTRAEGVNPRYLQRDLTHGAAPAR